MAEIGTVKEVEGNDVIVSLNRKEACNQCRACIKGMQEKEMLMKAENLCNAHKGDHVEVMLETTNFLKATFILYGIPLIALLVGVLVGYYGTGSLVSPNYKEITAIAVGFIFLALSYLVIKLNESKFQGKSYKPVAIKKVNE